MSFFFPGSDGDACPQMCTHVDDLLHCYFPEGKDVIEHVLNKFNIGSTEVNDFRYCGKQFSRSGDGGIYIDTVDKEGRSHRLPLMQAVQVARKFQAMTSHEDQIWHTGLAAYNL